MAHKFAFVNYLVATSNGSWGRGETLREALSNACAINNKTKKLRKGLKIWGWLNTQTESDMLTEEKVKAMETNQYCPVTGYSPGDYMNPFVNSYGGPCYYGDLVELDLDFI
jgi:hypothetical protein